MARIADTIAERVADQLRDNLAALIEHPGMPREAGTPPFSGTGDPSLAAYGVGLSLVFLLAETIGAMPEAGDVIDTIMTAETDFRPEGPPVSPLTASVFNAWCFFDLRLADSGDTIGGCAERIAERAGVPAGLLALLGNLNRSRMSFHRRRGFDGGRVLLEDIATGEVRSCHPPAGYIGEEDEIWFARLLPAATSAGTWVSFATPYVVTDTTGEALRADLDAVLATSPRPLASREELLKYGPTDTYWLEAIRRGYLRHTDQVIALKNPLATDKG